MKHKVNTDVDTHDKSCKICGSESSIWGCVDFNKSNGNVLPYCGIPIYYLKCNNCGFIFSRNFDSWTKQDFLDYVYNDEYIKVDPEYTGARSLRTVDWFASNVTNKSLSILDYGAGNATFGNELNKRGYNVRSWDPMWETEPEWDKEAKIFDMITAFEVFEHTLTPLITMREVAQWLKPTSGQILFSTLVNDVIVNLTEGNIRNTSHTYILPRGGHVCMHSYKSLSGLFATVGMKVRNINPGLHVAYY